ncbi:MAG: exodeoxyribonuclease VII large subunit [Firmicutes bacterium]|nr:exodeoxyribonuclease VII large subunit [Bacillota bacterium]
MALRPVSVTQLNDYIGRVLQTDPLLGNISVIGEISNLKYHSSGHVYFSLVDEGSKVNCFLPSSYAQTLPWRLGDGMEVVVRGYINVFKKGGTYTFFVRSLEISGDGSLAAAFQLLKDKLQQEGIFDQAHKKPIPVYPKKIGIVTSETGAAVRDILKIIQSRTKMTNVIVFPVLVQGEGAAADISAMLDYINENYTDIDTLIVGRGGGSMEDLWAFNEEPVARAIYRSRIPVISAVGHETDFTISDFAADKRAETPTAAAEMAVPNDEKLKEKLEWHRENLLLQLENKVQYHRLRADRYRLDLQVLLRGRLDTYRYELEKKRLILEENSPKRLLARGYAVVETADGRMVASVSELQEGSDYRIRMQDGDVLLTAGNIRREEKK